MIPYSLLLNSIGCCHWCRSAFRRSSILCGPCISNLHRICRPALGNINQGHGEVKVPWVAAATWNNVEQSQVVGALIRGAKLGRYPMASKAMAVQILRAHMALNGKLPMSAVLVPAPPISSGKRDHAFLLAETMSELTGWPIYTGLRRGSFSQQKKSNPHQRSQITFEMDLLLPNQKGTVIFVDDVVTTGSTARAVFRTLNQPGDKLAWFFAHRERSHP